MRFGLFGGAAAAWLLTRGIRQGFFDFVETNVEAEALGYHSSFVTEHHFTNIGQVSATLTFDVHRRPYRHDFASGPRFLVLPWLQSGAARRTGRTLDILARRLSISASAKATGTTSSRAFAMPPDRRTALRRRSTCSCARWGRTNRSLTAAASSASTRSSWNRHTPAAASATLAGGRQRRLDHGLRTTRGSIFCSTSLLRRNRSERIALYRHGRLRRRHVFGSDTSRRGAQCLRYRMRPRGDQATGTDTRATAVAFARSESRPGSHILGYADAPGAPLIH